MTAPKGTDVALQLHEYLSFRASRTGEPYWFTLGYFHDRLAMIKGSDEFNGVTFDSSGLLEDREQPDLLREWKQQAAPRKPAPQDNILREWKRQDDILFTRDDRVVFKATKNGKFVITLDGGYDGVGNSYLAFQTAVLMLKDCGLTLDAMSHYLVEVMFREYRNQGYIPIDACLKQAS
jgi:hypothetical protein